MLVTITDDNGVKIESEVEVIPNEALQLCRMLSVMKRKTLAEMVRDSGITWEDVQEAIQRLVDGSEWNKDKDKDKDKDKKQEE